MDAHYSAFLGVSQLKVQTHRQKPVTPDFSNQFFKARLTLIFEAFCNFSSFCWKKNFFNFVILCDWLRNYISMIVEESFWKLTQSKTEKRQENWGNFYEKRRKMAEFGFSHNFKDAKKLTVDIVFILISWIKLLKATRTERKQPVFWCTLLNSTRISFALQVLQLIPDDIKTFSGKYDNRTSKVMMVLWKNKHLKMKEKPKNQSFILEFTAQL